LQVSLLAGLERPGYTLVFLQAVGGAQPCQQVKHHAVSLDKGQQGRVGQ